MAKKKFINEQGIFHLIPVLLIAAVGILLFVFLSNTFSFKDSFFNLLFPKPSSHAVSEPISGPVNPIADLNGDDLVNLADFAIFLSQWGTTGPQADFNQDNIVNLADFAIFLSNWGS